MRRLRLYEYALAAAVALTGCARILDIEDARPGWTGGTGATATTGSTGTTSTGTTTGTTTTSTGCPGALMACGSTCSDVTTDGKNCGMCGHDCLGGQCSGSTCQPFTLATMLTSPVALVVDADAQGWVYFVDEGTGPNYTDGSVWRVKKDGTGKTLIAGAANANGAQVWPLGIAIDVTNVYWTASGNRSTTSWSGMVMSAPLAGGNAEMLATGQRAPSVIYQDATKLYWLNQGVGSGVTSASQGSLASCTKTSCTTTVAVNLGALQGPRGFALDSKASYVTVGQYNGNSMAILSTGATTMLDHSFVGIGGIVSDGTTLYFTEGVSSGSVKKVATSGAGGAVVVATEQSIPVAVVTDASAVYWVNGGDGTVKKIAK